MGISLARVSDSGSNGVLRLLGSNYDKVFSFKTRLVAVKNTI
jgi:hypothetical protein